MRGSCVTGDVIGAVAARVLALSSNNIVVQRAGRYLNILRLSYLRVFDNGGGDVKAFGKAQ